jgi:hypothetical protein
MTWEQLHGMAKSARTELERREFYDLLAVAESPVFVQQALDLALSGEPPTTIVPDIINVASRRHPETTFNFAVAHWDSIALLIEPNVRARYMPRLISDASDLKLIDKLDAFAAGHIPPGARQELRKTEANIRYLAQTRRERLPEVDAWLKGQGH